MNLPQKILDRLQNNKLVAIIVVVAIVVIALARFTDALETLATTFRRHQTIPPPVKPDETPVGPLWVVSVAEAKHSDGRYFDFDGATLEGLLGRSDWDKHVYLVSKERDGVFRRAVLWHSNNGGRGTAHGRFLPTGKPGDWNEGQSFYVVPKDLGLWDKKEQ